MIGAISTTGSGAIAGASFGISLIDHGFTGAAFLILSALVTVASAIHMRCLT